ncbi:hypothetical protein OG210_13735 [Streptomyces sp. NBC_00466]|uniref:hypothetical protein n=1 Tax=Streptomyces sp. NBC_00466 TaxID=2903655 RepID=UPI003249F921
MAALSWAFRQSPDPEHVLCGHRELLAAIRCGDEESAARAAHLDNEHNRAIALERLQTEPSSPWDDAV